MRRLFIRVEWVLAGFLAVMNVSSIGANAPVDPPCRGGVLYGTVWPSADGGWSGSSVSVYAMRADERGILGSARTDSRGKYRICDLPLRTRFQLVAVPSDASAGVHIETVMLTLAGGQQRNVYPTRALQRLPDLILGHAAPTLSGTEAQSARVPSVSAASESLERAQLRALRESSRVIPEYVSTERIVTPSMRSGTEIAAADAFGKADAMAADVPDGVYDSSMRVVSGGGLLMYFSGPQPRYMQLRVDGTDGLGCYFEFDWGVDEQAVVRAGHGYDLVNPAWGRIRVERSGDDRLALDLSDVFTPVCRVPGTGGGPLTWERRADGWTRTGR